MVQSTWRNHQPTAKNIAIKIKTRISPLPVSFGAVGRNDREENSKETGPCNLASHWNVANYLKKITGNFKILVCLLTTGLNNFLHNIQVQMPPHNKFGNMGVFGKTFQVSDPQSWNFLLTGCTLAASQTQSLAALDIWYKTNCFFKPKSVKFYFYTACKNNP